MLHLSIAMLNGDIQYIQLSRCHIPIFKEISCFKNILLSYIFYLPNSHIFYFVLFNIIHKIFIIVYDFKNIKYLYII